jgi:hypothetical protein
VDVFDSRIQFHSRQRSVVTGQLFARLLEVIFVKAQITKRVDEIAGCKINNLRHHHRQERIERDVEWHAEKKIGAARAEWTRRRRRALARTGKRRGAAATLLYPSFSTEPPHVFLPSKLNGSFTLALHPYPYLASSFLELVDAKKISAKDRIQRPAVDSL